MPERIQRKRTKGWRMPPNTVYVGRPTKWGNPYTVEQALALGREPIGYARELVVQAFRSWLIEGPWPNSIVQADSSPLREALGDLRGKNLACFCPLDQPCHADVLLEIANAPERERRERGL